MSKPMIVVGLLLITGLLLAACSGGSAPSTDAVPEQPAGQDDGNNLITESPEESAETSQEDPQVEDSPAGDSPTEVPFVPTPSPLFRQSFEDNAVSDRDYSEYEIITLLPPDRIPALTNPPMYDADEADEEYDSEEMVIGIEYNGDARAYPVDVLSRHEIVNTTVGGVHAAVTW